MFGISKHLNWIQPCARHFYHWVLTCVWSCCRAATSFPSLLPVGSSLLSACSVHLNDISLLWCTDSIWPRTPILAWGSNAGTIFLVALATSCLSCQEKRETNERVMWRVFKLSVAFGLSSGFPRRVSQSDWWLVQHHNQNNASSWG